MPVRASLARNAAVAIAAIAASLVVTSAVRGYGTLTSGGERAEHQRITRAALACPGATEVACFEPSSILSLAGGGTAGAVAAPDLDELTTATAHCHDADFVPGGYPRTRLDATASLHACREYARQRFLAAVAAADELLDSEGRIIPSEVALSTPCDFAAPAPTRAKCDVLEHLGRALHATQDFYAHSNWTDEPHAPPQNVNNPVGLNQTVPADVMSLRSSAPAAIPDALTTGCEITTQTDPSFACQGRVRHTTSMPYMGLNKDRGLINPSTGSTSDPTTDRGQVGDNFGRAVTAAIADTQRQWKELAEVLISPPPEGYGARQGKLMICALRRDDPVAACSGRRIAIVIDSSGSNLDTDPANLRIAAGQELNQRLIPASDSTSGSQPDLSAVVDFDNAVRLVSPLADPPLASFAGIDSSGGTDIGAGVNQAIAELTKDPALPANERSGIVVLTDGLDNGNSLLTALDHAATLGIRVNFGFLSPPGVPVNPGRARAAQAQFTPSPELVAAIAATGGTYSRIFSAESQRTFIDLVLQTGLTDLDDPNGARSGGPLELGVTSAGVTGRKGDVITHQYTTRPWRLVTLTVRALSQQPLQLSVRDVRSGRALDSEATGTDDAAAFRTRSLGGDLDVDVTAVQGAGAYELSVQEEGKDLLGTPGRDQLRCGSEPTYVEAGNGDDAVTCGPAPDSLLGGRGADRLRAGAGDDLVIIHRSDLLLGTEQVDGGDGNDTALFLYERPPGVRCSKGTTSIVRLSRRAAFRLRSIEKVLFAYRPCSAPRIVAVKPPRADAPPIPAPTPGKPPKPRLRVTYNVHRPATVRAIVNVSRATSVVVGGHVNITGLRVVTLTSARRQTEGRATLSLSLRVPPGAVRNALRRGVRARLTVAAVTVGSGGSFRKTTLRIAVSGRSAASGTR
ncbi:hypothetical protein OM076_13410 [Solirubrobacter ginsenosidimutans]|uniref:VWFA domain-containing protein n=1 Tax=Solirubrobacter ginsenosidimutans TaxID=490573 RepID=A0A9X3MRH6_9ACTN|nr:VWA domain-containing protein [Solirubrobacter ginsenosidimutans]MDA0161269.1 hypothetical protein [Solirubrobacter ginsenosidimutans]